MSYDKIHYTEAVEIKMSSTVLEAVFDTQVDPAIVQEALIAWNKGDTDLSVFETHRNRTASAIGAFVASYTSATTLEAAPVIAEKAPVNPATPRQIRYLRDLGATSHQLNGITKRGASALIDQLKSAPRRPSCPSCGTREYNGVDMCLNCGHSPA